MPALPRSIHLSKGLPEKADWRLLKSVAKRCVSRDNQRPQRVLRGVGLEVWRQTRRHLTGIGEYQYFPALQRREFRRLDRAGRLDLELFCDQRLEGLVTLS